MTNSSASRPFILFDLDGTLVDPAPGIVASVQHALAKLEQEAPAYQDLHWVIGPPLRHSFEKLLGSDTFVERAVDLYREAYSASGLFDAAPYDGIRDALASLRRCGYRLFLCTSKPLLFARQVIHHFGFSGCFEDLFGAELDARFDDKGTLVSHILSTRNLRREDGCMVGDRAFDVLAARQNGMASIGVTWGYGGRSELQENGATVLCERVGDLPDCVHRALGQISGD
ncbi:phosphoglycolate phosphatase [Aliiruegeria haliotis]|uniref:Phosphoglycolate phosphatase n=1 Tax=Aliiruegeria haliotis TaxID=1280846 RepID=A0A2T0RR44_9RHOB|nr:HAD hydrolase-like protein [Aliiruegeria haliotis]PRY23638.1 phosphoglycolate phosphatase [Aliiruegeria haliotis]